MVPGSLSKFNNDGDTCVDFWQVHNWAVNPVFLITDYNAFFFVYDLKSTIALWDHRASWPFKKRADFPRKKPGPREYEASHNIIPSESRSYRVRIA